MNKRYVSPLSTRYGSVEMQYLFSAEKKFTTWRKLWVILAKAEKQLGIDITDEQIEEMENNVYNIDYDYAAEMEKKLRHDVMAHVHAFGKAAPSAMPIIHLGATSCYVGDNTDVLIMYEALLLIRKKILTIIKTLGRFAEDYKSLPTLGFTHFQPAQLTTVGKRACLWINDLLLDLSEVNFRIENLKLLGSKGATGTQASFLELFGGDGEKVKALEDIIVKELDFPGGVTPVSGQTYSRKQDYMVLSCLSGIAQSAGKFANDMRLLAGLKELEEPFEDKQVGSSAMPYKRNPMRSERISAISRYVISNAQNGAMTSYNQWFERTLDDSANRRIAIPEGFLAVDAVLDIYLNIVSGIKVYQKVIEKRIMEELPFMATENIMMGAVLKGGDRQEIHEAIRLHSAAAGAAIKIEGENGDLVKRIAADPVFNLTEDEIIGELKPEKYVGMAPQQVSEFLNEQVYPILKDCDLEEITPRDLNV